MMVENNMELDILLRTQIEVFKISARKFGLPEDEIGLRIAAMTSSSTLGKIHKKIIEYENSDKRQKVPENKIDQIGSFRREPPLRRS